MANIITKAGRVIGSSGRILKSGAIGISIDGLQREYLMDGDALDTSGNGEDLTIVGATLTSGKDGVPNTAYNLPNTTDVLKNISTNLQLSSYASVCGWLYLNAEQLSWQRVFRLYHPANHFVDLAYSAAFGGWYTVFGNSNVVKYYTQNISIALNTWYFFIVEVQGVETYLYLNDSLQPRTLYLDNSPVPWINQGLTINLGNAQTGTNGMNQKLDNVRIYDRILTSVEKTVLYNE